METIAGVKEVQSFVAATNLQSKGSCGIGGMLKGISYDPRIANCVSGTALEACKLKFKGECQLPPGGFSQNACCDMSVFGSEQKEQEAYDPKERSPEELALTAAVIQAMEGQCHYGSTADGKEDAFKVVCDSLASADLCVEKLGRPAKTACSKKIQDGWVTSPCCMLSPKALQFKTKGTISRDVAAPKAGEDPVNGKGLKMVDSEEPKKERGGNKPLGVSSLSRDTLERSSGPSDIPAGRHSVPPVTSSASRVAPDTAVPKTAAPGTLAPGTVAPRTTAPGALALDTTAVPDARNMSRTSPPVADTSADPATQLLKSGCQKDPAKSTIVIKGKGLAYRCPASAMTLCQSLQHAYPAQVGECAPLLGR